MTFQLILPFIFLSIAEVVAEVTFNFTAIGQCEPFSISFTGLSSTQQSTNSLTLVPLESAPVAIPMTMVAANTASIYLTSIPLPAGTQFVASLENSSGRSIAKVSNLTTILTSDNTSCLPTTSAVPRRFVVEDGLSQCQEFSIQYNTTSVTSAPKVKAYSPQGISLVLNNTYDDPSSGTAGYLMGVSRGKQVALLIDGGNGIRETTSLITISGDESSSLGCLQAEKDIEAQLSGASRSSKAVIIGASSGGAAVALVGLAMVLFIVLDRKRRRMRRLESLSFHGSRMFASPRFEKAALSTPTMIETPRIHTGSVVDPTYTISGQLGSPQSLSKGRTSFSWGQGNERTHTRHMPRPSIARSETRNVVPHPNYDTDRLSLNSLDIEGMLNMATMQAESTSFKSSATVLFGDDSQHAEVSKSPEAINRSLPDLTLPRRTLKVNSDVPEGALSGTPSFFSFTSNANPFVPDEEIVNRASRRYQPTSLLMRTPGGSLGLPSSPRSVMLAPGRASVAGSSRSSSDWYGIGIAR